jgi:hypothetical protein
VNYLIVFYLPFRFGRTELLKRTGVLEEFPSLSAEQSNMLAKWKDVAFMQADKYRTAIRRRLNPSTIQSFFTDEKEAAFGLAGGAAIGLFLK